MGDLDADVTVARAWWAALRDDLVPEVVGLWFGMFEAAVDDGVVLTLYVAGTPTFDPGDETGDWAAEYVWEPDDRYVVLPGLAALPHCAFDAQLEHAAQVVRELQPWSGLVVSGAAVGFDDGDLVVVHPPRQKSVDG